MYIYLNHRCIILPHPLPFLGSLLEYPVKEGRTGKDVTEGDLWIPSLTGYQHNFNTYDDNFITDLNTPYDYESLMHYGPFSFNKNDSVPTITTKIPEFNTIIGQRLDFSEVDLERLNRMYNCSEYLWSEG